MRHVKEFGGKQVDGRVYILHTVQVWIPLYKVWLREGQVFNDRLSLLSITIMCSVLLLEHLEVIIILQLYLFETRIAWQLIRLLIFLPPLYRLSEHLAVVQVLPLIDGPLSSLLSLALFLKFLTQLQTSLRNVSCFVRFLKFLILKKVL